MSIKVISVNVPGKGTVETTEVDGKAFEFTYNGEVIPKEVVEREMKSFWGFNRDALLAALEKMP